MVVEAVLVAVIILTAILFFTSVQKPARSGQEGSSNLGRVASDTLGILTRKSFLVTQATACAAATPPSGSLTLEAWVGLVLAGDCNTAHAVDDDLALLVPSGARYAVRLNNGLATTTLLPYGGSGAPAGANAAETPIFPRWNAYADQSRTVMDGVTASASTSVSSATANFAAGDVGKRVVGPGIPAGALIVSRTSSTVVVLSAAATATATGLRFVIDAPSAAPGAQLSSGELYGFTQAATTKCLRAPVDDATAAIRTRTVNDGVTTIAQTAVASATAAFTAADIGKRVLAAGVAVGTTVVAVPDATHITLSAPATATASAVMLSLLDEGSKTGPAGATWVSLWQGQTAGQERVPPAGPFGVWQGFPNVDCTGTPVYGRVELPTAQAPDDFPIYGLQLVIWYGA